MATIGRRELAKTLAIGLAATAIAPLGAQPQRRLNVGHTGITWGFKPTDARMRSRTWRPSASTATSRSATCSRRGRSDGGLKRSCSTRGLPLHSAYCPVNLTDPAKRRDEIDKLVRWGQLIRSAGGIGRGARPQQRQARRVSSSPITRRTSSRRSTTCARRSPTSASSARCTSTPAPASRRVTKPTR